MSRIVASLLAKPYLSRGSAPQSGILSAMTQSSVPVGRILVAVAKALFVTAGLSFWAGGEVFRRTFLVDRVSGEFAGVCIAIVCVAVAIRLYTIGDKLRNAIHWSSSEITSLHLTR